MLNHSDVAFANPLTARVRPRPARSRLAAACIAAIGLAAHAGAIHAQTPAEASDAAAEEAGQRIQQLDAVVTTASRVRRGGFVAPTPTTQITAEDIAATGLTNVADVVNEIPSVRPSMTPVSTVNNASWSGGHYLDLRGLGFNRTLVLVDGKRFVPTQISGPVNINVIPQALIGNVDIVTGGASAAWGSDAVAGVVNFMFDHQLEGVRGEASYGSSDHGDYRSRRVSLAFGQRFGADRGHVLFGAEAADNSGIARLGDRDWGAQGWGTITNPAYTPDNDEPRILVVPNVVSAVNSFGGLINSGPLAGIHFDSNGDPVPFRYGEIVSGNSMIGGDGAYTHVDQTLAAPQERKNVYGRVSYDITDATTLYVEGAWARSDSSPIPNLTRSDNSIRIHRDNAFLPAAIGEAMDVHGIDSFTMGRLSRDYARTVNEQESSTERVVVGLEGYFGDTWSWDGYYTYGKSESTMLAHNNRITSRYNAAIDAVFDPVTGAIVCRNAAARAAGCVPMSLFGEGAPSADALGYVVGTAWRHWDLSQHAAAATVSGEPFQTAAGPVSIAAGLEWRREEAVVTSDELSRAAEFVTGNTVPWQGVVTVREAFSEMVVPLANGRPWAKALDLNLAGRVTDYSTSGTVSSWKIGGLWDINETWRLRATRSRDIRAPSLSELFSGSTTSIFSVLDQELGATYSVQSLSSGNPNLKPEEADTTTIGIVVNPHPNLMLSLDYYNIDIDGAIITLQAAAIANRCFGVQPQLCDLISRGDDGRISHVDTSPQNLQTMKLRGADLEALYRQPLGAGDLTVRALVSYVDSLELDDGEVVTRLAGSVDQPTISSAGGVPHWNGSLRASYATGPLTLGLGVRHVGGGKIDHTLTEKDRNVLEASSRTYFDLNGAYDLTGNLSLFGTVRNLFDKDPPITSGGFATVRSLYDVIGRTYTVGMRFRF